MTTTVVWKSLLNVSKTWTKSRVVEDFRSELPQNQRRGSTVNEGVARINQFGQTIDSNPLQFYKAFPHMGFDLDLRTREFMANSELIERSVTMLVSWIRSRLPRYPLMPAPQLAANSFHTANGNSFDVPWFKEVLRSGLQYQDGPPQIDQNLGILSGDAARELAESLVMTEEWRTFSAVSRIEPRTTQELMGARKLIEQRLIDADVGTLTSEDPRIFLNQRRSLTEQVVSELTPDGQAYAVAFDGVDSLINLVATTVLSQLLAFGGPGVLTQTTSVEVEPDLLPYVRFDLPSAAPTVGRLYWIESPAVRDVVHIESVSFSDSVVHGARANAGGTVLVDTANAWRRPTT